MSSISNVTGTTGYDNFDLLFVRSNLSGGILVGVFYGMNTSLACTELTIIFLGMVLVLYAKCMQTLWYMRKRIRNANILMLHSTIVFIMNTLYTASVSRVLELTFVDNDDFPGGPFAYLNLEFFIPINILGSIVFLIANWLLDALMVRIYCSLFLADRLISINVAMEVCSDLEWPIREAHNDSSFFDSYWLIQ